MGIIFGPGLAGIKQGLVAPPPSAVETGPMRVEREFPA
jgi:hypothetical protein